MSLPRRVWIYNSRALVTNLASSSVAGYLPPTPQRPAHIYGHLPFSGVTQPGDVFYRCEHWATSRSVRHATNDILAGTYTKSR